jgi:hypothetical protein
VNAEAKPLIPLKKLKALEVQEVNTTRRYGTYWSGFNIADLIVQIKPMEGGFYAVSSHIRSYGLARMISGYSSNTKSFLKKEGFTPVDFYSYFKLRNKERTIAISYDKDGKIVEESNKPAENRHKRPAVKAKGKNGVHDPLSAALLARKQLIDTLKAEKKSFSTSVYDGRRRFDLLFTVHGLTEEGRVHISFKEDPIAGYTNNELKTKKERGDPEIHIYLSPEDLLPVKAVGKSILGTAHGILNAECEDIKSCFDE